MPTGATGALLGAAGGGIGAKLRFGGVIAGKSIGPDCPLLAAISASTTGPTGAGLPSLKAMNTSVSPFLRLIATRLYVFTLTFEMSWIGTSSEYSPSSALNVTVAAVIVSNQIG